MVYEISKSNNKSVIVTHKHQAPHHRRPRQDAVECVIVCWEPSDHLGWGRAFLAARSLARCASRHRGNLPPRWGRFTHLSKAYISQFLSEISYICVI